MTMEDLDESYADRPATTMRVPLPTHVQFSERRADGSSSTENVHLVRSNEALKARPDPSLTSTGLRVALD